jgi:KDO2-lipid IV(A) lauroyltransferase
MDKHSLRLRRHARRCREGVLVAGAHAAVSFVGRLTLQRSLTLANRGGDLAYRLLREPGRHAAEHIRLAFGEELTAARRQRLVRAAFANVLRSFGELVNIEEVRGQAETYFEIVGNEHLQDALAAQNGAIVVTGQTGNWELLAAYWAWHGTPVAAIAHRRRPAGLQRLELGFRERQGVMSILPESPNAEEAMLAVTRRNGLLLVVIDQDPRVAKLPLPIFGRAARRAGSVARFAVRRSLPVLPVFIQRRPQQGHRITVSPAITPDPSGGRRLAVQELTRQLNEALETQIRNNPAEWPWWRDSRGATRRRVDPREALRYPGGAAP